VAEKTKLESTEAHNVVLLSLSAHSNCTAQVGIAHFTRRSPRTRHERRKSADCLGWWRLPTRQSCPATASATHRCHHLTL